jgi:hypothetical protein
MHGKDHTAECRVGGTCCRGVPWQVLYRWGMRGPGACAGLKEWVRREACQCG